MMPPTHRTLLPLQLLLFLSTALAQFTIVDNFYWQDYTNDCEASCLTNIFDTQQCTLANACNSNNCLTLDDSCLCGTSSWLIAVSKCIGKTVGLVQSTMQQPLQAMSAIALGRLCRCQKTKSYKLAWPLRPPRVRQLVSSLQPA
jgi:hypothetical protein